MPKQTQDPNQTQDDRIPTEQAQSNAIRQPQKQSQSQSQSQSQNQIQHGAHSNRLQPGQNQPESTQIGNQPKRNEQGDQLRQANEPTRPQSGQDSPKVSQQDGHSDKPSHADNGRNDRSSEDH